MNEIQERNVKGRYVMKITVVAVSAPALNHLVQFRRELENKYQHLNVIMRLFYVAGVRAGQPGLEEQITEAVGEADIAVIDIMGAPEAMQDAVRRGLEKCGGERVVIGNACRDLNRLGSFSMDKMQKMKKDEPKGEKKKSPEAAKEKPKKNAAKMMHTMRRMALMMGSVAPFGMMKDMKNLFLLIDYWQQAQQEDIYSFMYLLLRGYGGMKELPKEKPCSMRYGIYLKHPQTAECMEQLKTWWKKNGYDREKPLIALLFYGHSYPNDFLGVVSEVYRKLSKTANVLPIAFSQNEDKDLPKLEAYLTENEKPVDAVVNFMPFRLGAGPMGGDADGAVKILKKVNAPYFKPFCLTKTGKQEWEYENAVSPGEFLISIMLPELDGGILTYPVGIMEQSEYLEEEQLDITKIGPLDERIDSLCSRVMGYISLRKKPNSEKKLAVVCYNYPPGEDNLFGGAFLDTFASVEVFLEALRQNGYCTERLEARQLKEYFGGGACNEPEWSDGKKAAQSYTLEGRTYPVNGIQNKNVFIGLQPCRTQQEEGQDAESSYHDKNLAPPKEYQAFYRWITREYQADAVIHVGTHGTLEFLPGKDNGMMGSCWPDKLTDNIPHFYFYYMGNPSEAMTAKRRSHAVLVSYQPPAFVPGGLYGEYQKLKEMIAEYRESLQLAPQRSGDILRNIEELAGELGLTEKLEEPGGKHELTEKLEEPGGKHKLEEELKEPGIETGLTEKLDELDGELYEYETSLIPDGLHILQKEETEGMLSALRGEYLAAAPGGDILKNPDLRVPGCNLVQFDPRLVPTKTAFSRGQEIARQTLERYLREKGREPDSTAVILWGLETSKTQGETIGQIMYYLGIRMRQFEGSFDTRFEIIPTEELQRRRIDVTIHICGFFRDMYPNLLDNFNEIFRKLDALDETDEQSGFAENTRRIYDELLGRGYSPGEAREFARSRIFGPKAGEYGTSLTNQIRKGSWSDEEELAVNFTDSLSYVYSGTKRGEQVRDLLDLNYRNVEMMSQVRNNVEYELVDLDHYYEFYGGLAKAVENVRGCKAAMYVADTAGDRIRTQDVRSSIEKGIRTRLLNPRWIEGMMRHDYHGVQQIAKRFENVIGLTATTNQIDSRIFSELEKCYVEDEDRKTRMQRSNRWAYLNMLNRLAEAHNRGYWQATEQEMELLQRTYLETEGAIEE